MSWQNRKPQYVVGYGYKNLHQQQDFEKSEFDIYVCNVYT